MAHGEVRDIPPRWHPPYKLQIRPRHSQPIAGFQLRRRRERLGCTAALAAHKSPVAWGVTGQVKIAEVAGVGYAIRKRCKLKIASAQAGSRSRSRARITCKTKSPLAGNERG